MDRLEDAKLMKFSDPSFELLFSNLGESLFVEILARLPSRAAIRLKLVCKSWCSLISSHYFITLFNHRRHDPSLPPILHHPHSSSPSPACFIFQNMFNRNFPIVCDGYPHPDANSCGFRRLDLGFLPCPDPNHRIEVKGSCADLILCASIPIYYSPSVSAFYVCNQLTKQWTALPPPPLQFQSSERERHEMYEMSTGFLCVPAPCSLCTTNQQSQCVDHSRYDCVVVHICVYPPISYCKYRLQLFSSQEWKSLVVSSPRPIFARFLVPSTCFLVTYKGMLHMLLAKYILVYDPYNCPEKFCRVIDMPTDVEDEKCFTRTLGLSQNRLRVTCQKGAHLEAAYYIWELEDYDMGKWSLVHKFYITPNIMILSSLDLVHPNLDPKIKDTGFIIKDGIYLYWTNSSGWSAFGGIVHSITQQWWPTPVPPLIRGYTIENNKNTLGNS
ncbi:uncharacterized protein LOC116018938 [Ipomoea triloba]|uniref:uncharacterized protein LOC116018938 n=1 Tax=Ipomoea triloba TaxID=35885 RepID=UPI00125E8B82|nr:uncharacterized protein LOC116018938 [Ipomoea triloba]XP_031114852.1 uncharacterized protein LOC116018938 [Ipomoea triloba]XP_031114853.1 uncharacterized protein LOC116018938 [Ipomoea triloba]XP_031114854.1 uncharacterized protein LOC116018938 [Ipomoea triloba]